MSRLFEEDKDWQKIAAALLVLLFCLLYLAFLGVRPLFIPDETRYGEIAREMIASSDWIVPRLNGLLYFEKPPFGHWLNAISLAVFGENPFAVRFAGAMATGVSAVTVFFLGRSYFEQKRVAFLAVFIFLTTLEVQGVATTSTLDSMFSAALNIGIALFAAAAQETNRRRGLWLFLSGVFLGIAFLTKGFLGWALPFLVLTPWLLMTGRLAFLLRRGWIVVLVAALVVAPWALAIHQQQPDFWRHFFWVEHIQRFTAGNAQHEEAFYYFLMLLPLVAFPWIALLPAAWKALRGRADPAKDAGSLLLLFLWAVVPFVFLSIASGKLITYILPCYVPLSLIIAAGLCQKGVSKRLIQYGMGAAALLPIVLLAAVLYIRFGQAEVAGYASDEKLQLFGLIVALLLAIVVLVYGVLSKNARNQILTNGVAVSIILVAIPWVLPAATLHRKAPVAFLEQAHEQVPANTIVVASGSMIQAASWALRRDDVYVVQTRGEVAYGLAADDARGRYLSTDDFGEMLQTESNVLLLCKGECQNEIMSLLPANSKTWSYGIFSAHLAQMGPDSQ